jgi:menaquinone-dependent protoporphyrinogen IX oxidase
LEFRGEMTHRRLLNVLLVPLILLSASAVASGQVGSNDPWMDTNKRNDMNNIKVLIVYQSKYGSTKQYAEWIHQEIKGDLVNIENGDKPDLAKYDIIIIGGYVRTGNIAIAPFIKDHWGAMKEKEVILFTASGTPPQHPRIQNIYKKDLPEEIRDKIKYFPLHGRISRKDLTAFDKFLIPLGKIMEQDESLKKEMGKNFDGVRRENLIPLTEYLKGVRTRLISKKND